MMEGRQVFIYIKKKLISCRVRAWLKGPLVKRSATDTAKTSEVKIF